MTKTVWVVVAAVLAAHQTFVTDGAEIKRIHNEPAEWENEADSSHHFLGDFPLDGLVPLQDEGAPQNPDNADPDDDDYETGAEIEDDERVYKNPRNSPSAVCPRDEAHANFMGQKCLRKCSSDDDCKSKRKKCRCDGACGMSCIKPERECEELKSIEFGSISMTGRLFGSIATYMCKPDYHLVGLRDRTCQADGQWSGKPPTCKHNSLFCPFPGYVENGKVMLVGNMGLYDYRPYVRKVMNNKQIMYDCDKGYVLANGPPGATCVGGVWSPKQLPKCVPGKHPRLRWTRSLRRRRSTRLTPDLWSQAVHIWEPEPVPKSDEFDLLGAPIGELLEEPDESEENEVMARRYHPGSKIEITEKVRSMRQRRSTHTGPDHDDNESDESASSSSESSEEADSHSSEEVVEPPQRANATAKGEASPSKGQGAMAKGETTKGEVILSRVTRASKTRVGPQVLRANRHRSDRRKTTKNRKDPARKLSTGKSGPCEELSTEPYMHVTLVKPGRDVNDTASSASEVMVTCDEGYHLNMESNKTAKCLKGRWKPIKPFCSIDAQAFVEGGVLRDNNTCTYRNSEPNVVSFYNDTLIKEDYVKFPEESEVVSRCRDIGKFALIGSSHRKCINGEWDGQKPVCFGLNQQNDYALEKPPTILFRHNLGPIAQSNDGKLIVYPGTILHMECLWIRRFGPPKWTVSHNFRVYPTGWSTEEGRDSTLEYRLSILHASKDDSGTFSCTTPTRHTHGIQIEVKAVHCPELPQKRGITYSTTSTKMNTRVTISCANGNSLIGATELVCLPSGNWSANVPVCESVECADISGNSTSSNLRVSILSREVGGQAVFNCPSGYGLRGSANTMCQPSGEWAGPFPTCEEVHCEAPGIPENGMIQGTAPYKAGDVIQFSCNQQYALEGQPVIACQENGRWSSSVPKCALACTYPGTVFHGHISAVRFYYKIGENITFECDEGLVIKGASMLRCQRSGQWSNALPVCVKSTELDANDDLDDSEAEDTEKHER